jgi:hypothetical protein
MLATSRAAGLRQLAIEAMTALAGQNLNSYVSAGIRDVLGLHDGYAGRVMILGL